MDPRPPSDFEATGTLPISGGPAVPAAHAASAGREQPDWVGEARQGLTEPGRYLAYEESGRHVVVPLNREWTRIGRSLAADVRFDDATVSRRHGLVVCQDEGVRVLDDRSLNGVYVNGARVDWSPLADGDEITIGRHAIYFLEAAAVAAPAAPPETALTE